MLRRVLLLTAILLPLVGCTSFVKIEEPIVATDAAGKVIYGEDGAPVLLGTRKVKMPASTYTADKILAEGKEEEKAFEPVECPTVTDAVLTEMADDAQEEYFKCFNQAAVMNAFGAAFEALDQTQTPSEAAASVAKQAEVSKADRTRSVVHGVASVAPWFIPLVWAGDGGNNGDEYHIGEINAGNGGTGTPGSPGSSMTPGTPGGHGGSPTINIGPGSAEGLSLASGAAFTGDLAYRGQFVDGSSAGAFLPDNKDTKTYTSDEAPVISGEGRVIDDRDGNNNSAGLF